MHATLRAPFVDTASAQLGWVVGDRGREPLAELGLVGSTAASLTLGVLGASHQVRVRIGDVEQVEVVACGASRCLPVTTRTTLCGRPYTFRSEVRPVTEAVVRRTAHLLVAHLADHAGSLVAEFPGRAGAVTALRAEAAPRSLRWNTWHLYPAQSEIVRTWSEVRLR